MQKPPAPRRVLTSDQRRMFDDIDEVAATVSVLVFDARNHLKAGDPQMARRVLRRALDALPAFDEKISLTIEGCR